MVWTMIYLVGLGAIFSLIFAYYNFNKGTKMEHGTPVMQDIAKAIREGANAFLKREFSIEIPVILVIAVIFGIIFHYPAGLALLLGALMSSFAGLSGMRAAVIYNERVANEARLGVERATAADGWQRRCVRLWRARRRQPWCPRPSGPRPCT